MAGLTDLFKRGCSFYLRIVLPNFHPSRRNTPTETSSRPWARAAIARRSAGGTIKRAEVLAGLPLSTAPSAVVEAPAAPGAPCSAPHLHRPAKGLQPLEGQQEALC